MILGIDASAPLQQQRGENVGQTHTVAQHGVAVQLGVGQANAQVVALQDGSDVHQLSPGVGDLQLQVFQHVVAHEHHQEVLTLRQAVHPLTEGVGNLCAVPQGGHSVGIPLQAAKVSQRTAEGQVHHLAAAGE